MEFESWAETFRRHQRPIEDIFEFLHERFGIGRRDLETVAAGAPQEFRHAVHEVWFKIHKQRREKMGQSTDLIALNRRSKYDTENYVGVIQKRTQETRSPLGYSAWWLTLDRQAATIADAVKKDFGVDPPDRPVLSLDFLAQYLTFGPMRPCVPKSSWQSLPVSLEPKLVRFLTRDLLEAASAIRSEMKELPEYVIRRRVRNYLDEARQRIGPIASKGLEVSFEEAVQ